METILTTVPLATANITAKCKAIKFTNKYNNIEKIVIKWNIDEMGDLLAVSSTGASKYVCPYSIQYIISEVDYPIL